MRPPGLYPYCVVPLGLWIFVRKSRGLRWFISGLYWGLDWDTLLGVRPSGYDPHKRPCEPEILEREPLKPLIDKNDRRALVATYRRKTCSRSKSERLIKRGSTFRCL